MTTFEFSLVASGLDPTAEDFETRFYEAGCDDATVSFQKGRIIIDFAREAETFARALASAMVCVQRAGATLDRVEPDPLVNLSDIATRARMTRAAMSLYAKGQRGSGFPAPVARVTSDAPLWDWAEVAEWLYDHDKISGRDLTDARLLKTANDALRQGIEPAAEAILRREAELRAA